MLSVIVAGVKTSLDDGVLCNLIGYDGWGMAPQHRLSSRGPLQHGESDLGYRLDARFGKLILQLVSTGLGAMYDGREALLALFGPANAPILEFDLPSAGPASRIRHIQCVYHSDMSMAWDVKKFAAQRVALTLKCPDPSFYDPSALAVTFALGGGTAGFTVPTPVPTDVGASTIDMSVAITYPGSWISHPHLIRITGPITDCVITNETTGEKLDFTGATIAAGDWYDIDCRYGYKTVVDSLGANQIADLTDDSDLATWHLAHHPEAAGGINSIRVTGNSVTTATRVDISYFVRYIGL